MVTTPPRKPKIPGDTYRSQNITPRGIRIYPSEDTREHWPNFVKKFETEAIEQALVYCLLTTLHATVN
jgi:hypothetical protein